VEVRKVVHPLSRRLIVTLLVMLGAGAAVGPVLAPKLLARTAVTATQALQIVPHTVEVTAITCGANNSSDACQAAYPGTLGGNARVYTSVSDDRTKFTAAVDLLPTSSYLRLHIGVINTANNQVLARLKLNVPDGFDYFVSPYYYVVGEANFPAPNTDPTGQLDRVKAIYNLTRLDVNTWEIKLMPSARGTLNPHAISFSPGDIYDIHIDFALRNGTPPGFYVIQGSLEAPSV